MREIHIGTWFGLSESGRILHSYPDGYPGSRLAICGYDTGNIVLLRHDVGEETARRIEALAAEEPPLSGLDSVPIHVDRYLELLGREAPVETITTGSLSYCFPENFRYEHGVTLVNSDTDDGRRFLDDLPADGGFTGWNHPVAGHIASPWCMALHDGEVASIVETVRMGDAGVECGVTTAPALRGRGFAAAAVAGWANLRSPRKRTRFYSTERPNRSSQRVTDRLGLRFIGADFGIT